MSSRSFVPKASLGRVRTRLPSQGPLDVLRDIAADASARNLRRSRSPAIFSSSSHSTNQKATPCKNCGSTETAEGDGNLVCQTCGLVLSNAPNYTSDITFEEGSNGRIQQQGQRIADGQTHQRTFTPRWGSRNEAMPSKDKAISEATGVIRRYAMLLRIDEREVNVGRNIFSMAYNRGFVRGRTIESVALVSVYIATRRAKDRKPVYDIMLIDLAEKASINVFDLGKMMQDLSKLLYLRIDGTMDKDEHCFLRAHGAEVLIDKFVNHLDFGSDANKIKSDAVRILGRMKRDWIHHGRRPSGVCGAAVILAARMNNFRRTLREVVLVAKVTEITVGKRLQEFKETESSELSINDFRNDNILASISETDPPAYSRALHPPKPQKRKQKGSKKRAPETAAEIEASETQDQTSESTDDQPLAKRARIDADGFVIPHLPAHTSQRPQASEGSLDPALAETDANEAETPSTRTRGRPKGSKNWKAPPPTVAEIAYEEELTSSMQEALDSNQGLDPINQLPTPANSQVSNSTPRSQPKPSSNDNQTRSTQAPESLPLRVDPSECDPKKTPPGPAVNTDTGNTGRVSLDPYISETEFDSDPEVSTCLLSEAERVVKEKIWVTENAEWLRQDHAKRIRRTLKDKHLREQGIDPDEVRKGKKGEVKKRKDGARRSGRIGDVSYLQDDFHRKRMEEDAGQGASATAGDASSPDGGRRPSAAGMRVKAMMIQRGTYSRRINYDNLMKAYDYPDRGRYTTSSSRTSSVERTSREQSVVSVSSTGTAATGDSQTSSIGPIFRPRQSGRNRKSRQTHQPAKSTPSENRDSSDTGSASVRRRETEASQASGQEHSAAPEPEQDSRLRHQRQQQESLTPAPPGAEMTEDDSASKAAVPPSATAATFVQQNAHTDNGDDGVDDDNEDDGDEVNDDEDEEEEDGDDDEDEEEDDDDDEDLDAVFAGKFKERPVWQGEDEIVEEE